MLNSNSARGASIEEFSLKRSKCSFTLTVTIGLYADRSSRGVLPSVKIDYETSGVRRPRSLQGL